MNWLSNFVDKTGRKPSGWLGEGCIEIQKGIISLSAGLWINFNLDQMAYSLK